MITAGGLTFEVATVNGAGELYDPQTDTIYTGSSQPNDARPVDKARATKRKSSAGKAADSDEEKRTIAAAGDSYREKVLGLLESGKVHEAGRETVNGRDAIRLASDDASVTLLVDADNYEPIEWRVSEGGQSALTSFPVYERLAATDVNAALLSLTGRHVDATIDDDPAHYEAALVRLNPKVR
jgi:hypothetical protein